MATNILGYGRDQVTERLISSDYAALSLTGGGSGTIKLVQNAQLNYGHQVIPRFEAGSSELYWVTGQAQGRINIGRAVSSGGVFANIKPQDAATGELVSFSLEIKDNAGGNGSISGVKGVTGETNISFEGGVVVNLTANITTGNLDVAEGVEIAFADMIQG